MDYLIEAYLLDRNLADFGMHTERYRNRKTMDDAASTEELRIQCKQSMNLIWRLQYEYKELFGGHTILT